MIINELILSFKAALLVFMFPVLALMGLGALLQAFSAKKSATSQTKLTYATVLHLVGR